MIMVYHGTQNSRSFKANKFAIKALLEQSSFTHTVPNKFKNLHAQYEISKLVDSRFL